jgi:hypothetical protein
MKEEMVCLSYRELAERLRVSPDAARMKAKRKAKAGLWRIIPGNHPLDRVTIELPLTDLNSSSAKGEADAPVAPERTPKSIGPQRPEREHERADELYVFIEGLLAAQSRTEHLTDQLQEAHAAHAKTVARLHAEINALAADIRAEKEAHLGTAIDLGQQLRAEQNAHNQDAIALAAAQTRETAVSAELERAREAAAQLQAKIEQLQRPWWKKLTGG